MRAGRLLLGVVPMALALLLPPPADVAAQDVEAVAAMRGLEVPAAYRARIQEDSTAFTLPNGLFRVGPDGVPRVQARSGTVRMLVVPTLFADTPEPWVSREAIQRSLFDGPAPRGTLTEAYREFSRGILEVAGEVTPWVRTGVPLAEATGESSGLGDDTRLGEHLLAALRAVDGSVDFGLYDNDGPDGIPNSGDDDGRVDALAFEFLEVAASCGGPGVWPHRWGLTGLAPQDGPFVSDDPRAGSDTLFIQANAYIIQSATDCGGVEVQDASTIAHEFGHVLGLPDYYHPTDDEAGSFGRRWVLGCWGLMAAGAWGCGTHGTTRGPFGPTHLSARSKFRLDWLEYVVASEGVDREYVLAPVHASGEALRVPLDDEGLEALILEYRTREGFDAELPAEGVVVYRQDHRGVLRPDPPDSRPYFLRLLERDGNDGLVRNTLEGGNRGEAGDVWGTDGAPSRINGLTTPGTLRRDGSSSGAAVHSIRVEGGVARVRVSLGAAPGVALPADPLAADPVNPFQAVLTVGGGTMPYRLESELPDGFSAEVEEDELRLSGTLDPERATGDPLELQVELVDAVGSRSGPVRLPVATGPWIPAEESLLQEFLGSDAPPLTSAERTWLDFTGNRNGRYDVGDLRAWLRGGGPSGGG